MTDWFGFGATDRKPFFSRVLVYLARSRGTARDWTCARDAARYVARPGGGWAEGMKAERYQEGWTTGSGCANDVERGAYVALWVVLVIH